MFIVPSDETYVQMEEEDVYEVCELVDPVTGAVCTKKKAHVPPHEDRSPDFVITFESPKELILPSEKASR